VDESNIEPVLIGALVSGRYKVIDKLGEGGMGVLYRATDSEIAGRMVVLKFPKKDLLYKKGFRERFRREIESLVQFEHPHVVRVYGIGEHERSPYVVLQYLAGGSLEQTIEKEGALAPAQLMGWLPDLATALDSLHKQGIIHRDVKAGNILFDSYGEVYLSDFGIVKVLGEIESGTSTGSGLGSPESLAPESVSNNPPGGEYDQYGLATAVYQALCGRLPFGSTNALDLLTKIVSEAPAPLNELAPNVGQAFSCSVMKALSKKPTDRFRTCTEFVDELERAMNREASAPPPPVEALLEIRCSLAGATVTIDGIAKGTAPVSVRLAKGSHVVRVERDSHNCFEQRIDLNEDKSVSAVLTPRSSARWVRHLAVTMTIAFAGVGVTWFLMNLRRSSTPPISSNETVTPTQRALLNILSEPSGAKIFLDNTGLGSAPVLVKVPRGQHVLRGELPGFQASLENVEMGSQDRSITITLKRSLQKLASQPHLPSTASEDQKGPDKPKASSASRTATVSADASTSSLLPGVFQNPMHAAISILTDGGNGWISTPTGYKYQKWTCEHSDISQSVQFVFRPEGESLLIWQRCRDVDEDDPSMGTVGDCTLRASVLIDNASRKMNGDVITIPMKLVGIKLTRKELPRSSCDGMAEEGWRLLVDLRNKRVSMVAPNLDAELEHGLTAGQAAQSLGLFK
jgi:serine/threonine protein kinase